MNKVYLLDRNVVSLIKMSLKDGNKMDSEKRVFLNKLRKIDRSWNTISPLLAIMEGQYGRPESPEELLETAKQESHAVAQFFRYARNDEKFFLQDDRFRHMPNGLREDNFDLYVKFLSEVVPDIIQTVAAQNREGKMTKILDTAAKMGVLKSHIIVVCVLSALYGNQAAKGILNPRIKGNKSHNAACDLMVLSRLAHIETAGDSSAVDFKFITMDKSLSTFLKLIQVKRVGLQNIDFGANKVRFYAKYSFDKKLFPDMSDVDFNSLLEKLSIPEDDEPHLPIKWTKPSEW